LKLIGFLSLSIDLGVLAAGALATGVLDAGILAADAVKNTNYYSQ